MSGAREQSNETAPPLWDAGHPGSHGGSPDDFPPVIAKSGEERGFSFLPSLLPATIPHMIDGEKSGFSLPAAA